MLKLARQLARVDQGELARLVGISRKTVVVVERELPAKVDPRRRAVLERIRSLFETKFKLEFDTEKETIGRLGRTVAQKGKAVTE
jgi:DNA-binding XRE family transcriptional regulator